MEVAIFIINSIPGSKLFYIELSTEYLASFSITRYEQQSAYY